MECQETVYEFDGTTEKILTTFVLTVITVISSIPLLSRTLLWGADLEFHLFRIEGIAQGLRDGQFPVLMQTVQVGGMAIQFL